MHILSINIEDKNHIERVTNCVLSEKPDVLLIQEIRKTDLQLFSSLVGGTYHFASMAYKDTLGDDVGIATFTALPVTFSTHTLKMADMTVASYTTASFEDRFRSQSYHVLEALIDGEDGAQYRLLNTHLPVTKSGSTTEFQLDVIGRLLAVLEACGDFVLVGDSNAPRGGEAFAKIAAQYKDNIPPEYTTSIDGTLHRAGTLEYMIDVLFTTPKYLVNNPRFISGVSDHYALSALISRV